MAVMERRSFLQFLAAAGLMSSLDPIDLHSLPPNPAHTGKPYRAARIVNEYTEFLPGEREALSRPPSITAADSVAVRLHTPSGSRALAIGETEDGWRLLTVVDMNGISTAVFEKHATHRGAIAFVTVDRGTIALIPKGIGDLAQIRPRLIAAPAEAQMRRPRHYTPAPDLPGDYILNSSDDPCYENVAALGPEFIGWTLVANEAGGPQRSLFLEADGTSREINNDPPQASWAPDELSAVFDPKDLLPNDNVPLWSYQAGFSKRTLLGGFTPAADIGVWNPQYKCGYEVMVLLPEGADAKPVARVRLMIPEDQITPEMHLYRDPQGRAFVDRFVNGNAQIFFAALAGIWNHWNTFFQQSMPVTIPDEWLLESARAGIMLAALQLSWARAHLSDWRRRLHEDPGAKPCPVSGRAV